MLHPSRKNRASSRTHDGARATLVPQCPYSAIAHRTVLIVCVSPASARRGLLTWSHDNGAGPFRPKSPQEIVASDMAWCRSQTRGSIDARLAALARQREASHLERGLGKSTPDPRSAPRTFSAKRRRRIAIDWVPANDQNKNMMTSGACQSAGQSATPWTARISSCRRSSRPGSIRDRRSKIVQMG
jgi:hypothetical protein